MFLLLKALHIISFVCWFAAIFYLPRLFVYHAQSDDAVSRDRFTLMERKLIRLIGTPAMIATLFFGLGLAGHAWDFYKTQWWFWCKLGLVLALVIYHHVCIYFWRQFASERNLHSHVFYRWFNEVPVVLLVLIVFLVVLKP